MQGNKKSPTPRSIQASFGGRHCHFEVKKSKRGAVFVLDGAVSISSFNEEEVVLLSQSGRIYLTGEALSVSVLENRTVEIFGKIGEIRLSYGKS